MPAFVASLSTLLAVAALSACASAPPALPPPPVRAAITQVLAAAPPAPAAQAVPTHPRPEYPKAMPPTEVSDANLSVAQIIAHGLGPPQVAPASRSLRVESLLRQQPKNASNVIITLASGSTVQPISQLINPDGRWWYVRVADVTGWLPASVLGPQ